MNATVNAVPNAKLVKETRNWFSKGNRTMGIGTGPKKVSILNLSGNKVLADSIKGALQADGKEVTAAGRLLFLFKTGKYDCIVTGSHKPWVLAWQAKHMNDSGLLIVDNGKTLVFGKDGGKLTAMTSVFAPQPCFAEPAFA